MNLLFTLYTCIPRAKSVERLRIGQIEEKNVFFKLRAFQRQTYHMEKTCYVGYGPEGLNLKFIYSLITEY